MQISQVRSKSADVLELKRSGRFKDHLDRGDEMSSMRREPRVSSRRASLYCLHPDNPSSNSHHLNRSNTLFFLFSVCNLFKKFLKTPVHYYFRSMSERERERERKRERETETEREREREVGSEKTK